MSQCRRSKLWLSDCRRPEVDAARTLRVGDLTILSIKLLSFKKIKKDVAYQHIIVLIPSLMLNEHLLNITVCQTLSSLLLCVLVNPQQQP